MLIFICHSDDFWKLNPGDNKYKSIDFTEVASQFPPASIIMIFNSDRSFEVLRRRKITTNYGFQISL